MSSITATALGALATAIIGGIGYLINRHLKRTDEHGDDIDSLEIRMNSAESRMSRIETDISNLEQTIQELGEKVEDHRDEISKRLTILKKEYSATRQDIKWIKKHLKDQ